MVNLQTGTKAICCFQSPSRVWLYSPMGCSTPGSSVLHYFLESNSCPLSHWCYITISSCHSLLLLPSAFRIIRVFSNELAPHIRWSKSWSFSISPSNEYSGFISFRIDWFDLLAVQWTLKSLLQHHSSKASILWHSTFMVQLSHPYMTIGKIIALTIWTFFGKEMSLLFNALSRFLIAFLLRKASFNFMAAVKSTVILEA